ncbi:Hypothetical protein Cp262_0072 [Corynebacterium pseudotuberculosis]|nr:Hypothetical protein Cp262_0072 [Corynebacterium pseudotuberculosis]
MTWRNDHPSPSNAHNIPDIPDRREIQPGVAIPQFAVNLPYHMPASTFTQEGPKLK